MTCYPACVICSNCDIVRSYRSNSVATHGTNISKRLTGMPVIKTTKELVDYFRIVAVSIYTIIWEFGWSVFAPISSMHYLTAVHLFHRQ